MGCNYYLKLRPAMLTFVCYNCGQIVYIDDKDSINKHKSCTIERDGEYVIPLSLVDLNDSLEER